MATLLIVEYRVGQRVLLLSDDVEYGCADLQPDLEAPANQVIAKPWLLRRASSSFVMSPPDLDFDLLAESPCRLNQRIQLDRNIAWIQYTI
jgi:hypothetical protein